MSVKRSRISLYVRQVPNSNQLLEVTLLSPENARKSFLTLKEEEYKDFCEWLENGEDDIIFALPFLTEFEQRLVTRCVKIKYVNSDDEEREMEHSFA